MIEHGAWPAGFDAGPRDRGGGGRSGMEPSLRAPAGHDRIVDGLRVAGPVPVRPGSSRSGDGRCVEHITSAGAGRNRSPGAGGAALVVGSAIAFALDGPMAHGAYQRGLDPAAFGFWRAAVGAIVLGGCVAARQRPGALAAVRRLRRGAAIRLVLAAGAGLGLNLALFEAFARLPVAIAVATFGCYPLLVAAWEAMSGRHAVGATSVGVAVIAVAGLVLLIRPDSSASVPATGVLLALLAAVLHAAYILLGRGGWGEVGDGTATLVVVATAALGLGGLAVGTRPAALLAPVSDPGLAGLLLLEGILAGAAAPLLFLAGLRRIGGTQTAVLSLCEPLAATLLAAVMFAQLLAPSQLLGGALLLGAGVTMQAASAYPAQQARRWPRPLRPPVRPLRRAAARRSCATACTVKCWPDATPECAACGTGLAATRRPRAAGKGPDSR